MVHQLSYIDTPDQEPVALQLVFTSFCLLVVLTIDEVVAVFIDVVVFIVVVVFNVVVVVVLAVGKVDVEINEDLNGLATGANRVVAEDLNEAVVPEVVNGVVASVDVVG